LDENREEGGIHDVAETQSKFVPWFAYSRKQKGVIHMKSILTITSASVFIAILNLSPPHASAQVVAGEGTTFEISLANLQQPVGIQPWPTRIEGAKCEVLTSSHRNAIQLSCRVAKKKNEETVQFLGKTENRKIASKLGTFLIVDARITLPGRGIVPTIPKVRDDKGNAYPLVGMATPGEEVFKGGIVIDDGLLKTEPAVNISSEIAFLLMTAALADEVPASKGVYRFCFDVPKDIPIREFFLGEAFGPSLLTVKTEQTLEKPKPEKAIDVSSHTLVTGKDGSLQFMTDTPVVSTDAAGTSGDAGFKAKSVSIIRGEMASCRGQMGYAITSSGPGSAEPASPNVIVIRQIAPEDTDKAKALGLKIGGAYLNKGSGKYEFLKDVDLVLSDEDIAREFGVPKGSSVDVIFSGQYFQTK
jgi:hypothetical protein